MKLRTLGSSDLHLTPLGFGAWAAGGPWKFGWGAQDDDASVAAIHRALELGINWIDTAAIYGLGHSEEVVARALAEWKGDRPYVFTKCSMVWDATGNVDYAYTEKSIRAEVEASLRRLKTDVIDLYQMHWPDDDMAGTLEGWAAMAKLKDEGKVRYIGASNFNVEEMTEAGEIAELTSLQPPYSLLARDVEADALPYCEANQIGVINYSPMGSGLFTGAMTRERLAGLAADDWRKNNPNFQEPKLTTHLAIADRLREVGARHGQSAGATAIAWCRRQNAITACIVGARAAEQVDGFIGAMDYTLTPADITYIESGRQD
ncbi:aldo/keto reductase [Synoicihabitans lomoniglobus]|uniref:Aldo/keto reductase n=1 Tax=Synoicihabitans lomoniglobus TaxID=2909285 RepID=A0AAE9ZU43_9BACT|nr:aldo/keto reductase [Opitutaceae bacterium LMO-M01]WED65190.1 aldo/keto reductase [Opitutaceae bacterium LMO-M01]